MSYSFRNRRKFLARETGDVETGEGLVIIGHYSEKNCCTLEGKARARDFRGTVEIFTNINLVDNRPVVDWPKFGAYCR